MTIDKQIKFIARKKKEEIRSDEEIDNDCRQGYRDVSKYRSKKDYKAFEEVEKTLLEFKNKNYKP